MHTITRTLSRALLFLAVLFPLPVAADVNPGKADADVIPNGYQQVRLSNPIQAKSSAQGEDLAFPSDSAGFSAYYRVSDGSSFSLDKSRVDDHIFSPIGPEDTGARTAPATLVSIGANYTVARVSVDNIEDTVSTVNLYYDDEGWVVSYLPSGAPSSQVWQARREDIENPTVSDISLTTLLDTLNLVIDEALGGTAIETDEDGLGYYHWQFPDADSFLMMAVARRDEGEYPVQFSVPASLTVAEVSATMWITQGEHQQAPCGRLEFDGKDLIAKTCEKGIYSSAVDLEAFGEQEAHSWKLVQSERNTGASGALLMIVYSTAD